jgi:hypothetical protein
MGATASITVLGQRHALAELDATIGRIEGARREQLALAARLVAAAADPAPVCALLRLTDDFLACLRQSQAVLLWELPQDGDHGSNARPAAAACRPLGATVVRPRFVE